MALLFAGLPSLLGASKAALRYPVALELTEDGKTAFTANSRSGSISVIDLPRQRVAAEYTIKGKLTDIALHPRSKFLLATDAGNHRIHFFAFKNRKLIHLKDEPCIPYPARVVISEDGATVAIASTWDQRLGIYKTDGTNHHISFRQSHTLSMPFPLREMLWVDGRDQFVVADAFGGNIAAVRATSGTVLAMHLLPAHNIRGLALDANGERLLISHQILNPLARTTFNDVHWGVLMANVIRSIPLRNLTDARAKVLRGSRLHRLGMNGPAAGDPAGIGVGNLGHVAVALAGIGGLETGPSLAEMERIETGERPSVVRIHGTRAYVLNTFGDSISIIDLKKSQRIGSISLGQQSKLNAAQRGERLFFDARLSHNGWLSCHSCHTGGHSNGMLNDNLGDNSFGAPKRVISLLGVADTSPWAWNGSITQLEQQVIKSIKSTMHGEPLSKEQIADLTAFLKTLPRPPVPTRARDPETIDRGKELFTSLKCIRCHQPPLYTTDEVYNVGFKDEAGNEEFNPPSLRGLQHRTGFFHDKRARTLHDVFNKYRHQLEEKLNPSALTDLVSFLRTL